MTSKFRPCELNIMLIRWIFESNSAVAGYNVDVVDGVVKTWNYHSSHKKRKCSFGPRHGLVRNAAYDAYITCDREFYFFQLVVGSSRVGGRVVESCHLLDFLPHHLPHSVSIHSSLPLPFFPLPYLRSSFQLEFLPQQFDSISSERERGGGGSRVSVSPPSESLRLSAIYVVIE